MINSNIVFVAERENQSNQESLADHFRTSAISHAPDFSIQLQRAEEHVRASGLCWLQRQHYDSGRGRVRWLISQANLGGVCVLPPKRRCQYSRWQIPFHLDTKVLSGAGDRLFLGHRLRARRPSGNRVHLQAAGQGEMRFETARGSALPRCRCVTKCISPSSRCLKSEGGSTAATQSATAGESVGVPVFLHLHRQPSLFH